MQADGARGRLLNADRPHLPASKAVDGITIPDEVIAAAFAQIGAPTVPAPPLPAIVNVADRTPPRDEFGRSIAQQCADDERPCRLCGGQPCACDPCMFTPADPYAHLPRAEGCGVGVRWLHGGPDDETGLCVRPDCRRWTCPRCRARRIDIWTRQARRCFKDLESVYVSLVPDEVIDRTCKRIRYHNGNYFRVMQPGGVICLYASVPFTDAEPIDAKNAHAKMRAAMELCPERVGRPVFASEAWQLSKVKSGGLYRVINVPGGGDLFDQVRFLDRSGVTGEFHQPRNGSSDVLIYRFELRQHQIETLRLRRLFNSPGPLNLYPQELADMEEGIADMSDNWLPAYEGWACWSNDNDSIDEHDQRMADVILGKSSP
jgi:hypothetical protein